VGSRNLPLRGLSPNFACRKSAVHKQKERLNESSQKIGTPLWPIDPVRVGPGLATAQEQETGSSQGERNRRLFTKETFGANGRDLLYRPEGAA
jgi:hypothetical protein